MTLKEFLQKRNHNNNILIKDMEVNKLLPLKNLNPKYLDYIVISTNLLPFGEIVFIKSVKK